MNPENSLAELKRRKAEFLSQTGASEVERLHIDSLTPERIESRLQDYRGRAVTSAQTIRLANSPLCSFVDRAFEVDEIAPKIYVLPFWIGTDRARAPKPETAT